MNQFKSHQPQYIELPARRMRKKSGMKDSNLAPFIDTISALILFEWKDYIFQFLFGWRN
jgi:hypothetical protein